MTISIIELQNLNREELTSLLTQDRNILAMPSEKGCALFHDLCQNGNFETVKRVIEIMSPEQIQQLQKIKPPANWNKIHLNAVMLDGSKHGSDNLVDRCLKLGSDSCAIDDDGNTALHHAMKGNHREVASILLLAGTDEHIRNKGDKTAIDLANAKLADWFIQKSRSMRLKQLLTLEQLVEEMRLKQLLTNQRVEEMAKEIKKLQKSPSISNLKTPFFSEHSVHENNHCPITAKL